MNIDQPACTSSLEVHGIRTDANPRIVNNRDGWFAGNLPQVDRYFDCRLVVR